MKIHFIVISLALLMLLTACGPSVPTESPSPTTDPAPTATPLETSTDTSTPDDTSTDTPQAEADFSQIPYYGDRSNCRLSAEIARAYAEAIREAKLDFDEWGYCSFDTLYPVLIDVSGDRIPLLLLVEAEVEEDWNILFGYADGALQRITSSIGIGIATVENERWLSAMSESDFGGWYYLYRVQDCAAELISETLFFDNWHEGSFHIDDVEVSEAEYRAELLKFPIERLMETDHPGRVYALEAFREYLSQPFTRNQAAQIFQDYAGALGKLTQDTTVEWKAVFEEPGGHFHLYVTINGTTDYDAGNYWPGVNFELDDVPDAPKNALSTLSTMWTGEGQWFYIYQKNDVELAVMNHPVIYPAWYIQSVKDEIGEEAYAKQYEEYQEILIIPIEKGSQIHIKKTVDIQKP